MHNILKNLFFTVLILFPTGGSCARVRRDDENVDSIGEYPIESIVPWTTPSAESEEKCVSLISNKGKGPVQADLDEFPWSAIIGMEDVKGKRLFCGGSLVTENEVLTHKSCVLNDTSSYFVRLGEYDLSKEIDCVEDNCAPPVQEIKVERVISAPDMMNNGVRIVLERPAKINAFVRPLCWGHLDADVHLESSDLVIVGWGISPDQKPSKIKRTARLQFKDTPDCLDFDLHRESEVINSCLEEGYEEQLSVLDLGGTVVGKEKVVNHNRPRFLDFCTTWFITWSVRCC